MSELVSPQPDARRASDADRDRVLAVLATATADGRLTIDEHGELMSRALEARTMGELAVLTEDLAPVAAPDASPATPVAARRPNVLAIFGARSKRGVWAVPADEVATAVFGAVELDYRQAAFSAHEVTLTANSLFGAVELTVPDWVDVIDEGHVLFGARDVRGAAVSEDPGRPRVRLRLRGISIFGAVEVRRKATKQPKAPKPKPGREN